MNSKTPNLNNVDTKAGFSHFDAGLTEQDETTLAKIKVDTQGNYDNFGAIDKIGAEAAEFFVKLGNSPAAAKKQALIVRQLVSKALEGFGSESALVQLRAFTPTDAFDISRWHTDGNFYGARGDQMKAVFTLKGASTLLHRVDDEQRRKIMELQTAPMEEMESRRQREALLDLSKTETTPAGSGTVFIIGGKHAAVHSEPPIPEIRIFLAVLPGTSEQIEKLQQDWDRANKTEIRLGDQKPAKVTKPPRPTELKR